jgi:DNA-binding response OmpR family regulator
MAFSYALVIVKNPHYAEEIQRALNQAGYQVQLSTTGSRAQVQLAFTTPDLIVLDLNLPDIPGEIILRQIKKQPRLRQSHLILLSDDDKTRLESNELADFTLLKPINSQQLNELAAHLLPI